MRRPPAIWRRCSNHGAFELLPRVVAGDRRDAQEVSVPVPGHGEEPIDYIAWLDLHAANLNRNDMITADLSHITMASAGIIEELPGAKTARSSR